MLETAATENHPVKTFICYAREDHAVVDSLKKQLAIFEKKRLLEVWSDGEILPGEHWDHAIKKQLEQAELILLFISVDFINSDYIEKTELQAALKRHRNGQATLIPIIVRSCAWQEYFDMGQFQALPSGARPLLSSHFPYLDEALHEVAEGIRKSADAHRQRKKTVQEREKREQAIKNQEKLCQTKDEAAWKAAVEEDTPEAYESYLKAGYTAHEAEAHERISALEKAAAKKRAAQLVAQKAAEAKQKADKAAAEASKYLYPDMVLVKGGSFSMGSTDADKDAFDREKPAHEVRVADFMMAKTPVTVVQFAQFIQETAYKTEADTGGGSYIWTGLTWKMKAGVNWRCDVKGTLRPANEQDHPVIHISWNDAQAYCKWLSQKTGQQYQLPTEAQWEYAARGGRLSKGFVYAGSHNLDEVGWYDGNAGGSTHEVAQKAANELGLYDMSGNVWEWCEDDWHDDYKGAPTDGSAWADKGNRGSYRVNRGGSWYDSARNCRVSSRSGSSPAIRYYHLGFRLASSPQ